jgi:preprotein translocase subunit YajC
VPRKLDCSKSIVLAIFLWFIPGISFAGQIVLQNGDRMTGTIIKADEKNLVIQTEYADRVTVKMSAIREISSTQALHVTPKEGQTVVGIVKTTDAGLEVETAALGAVTVPKDAIRKIRNEEEEAAYQKLEHPRLLDNWGGGTTVSFALTRGNSETRNLALAFNAGRKTLHDHIHFYANSVYATNDAPGAAPGVTANAIQGGARYDRDFHQRLFSFVGTDFQTDDLQDLNLRSVFSSGLGVHAVAGENTTLDFLSGANYSRENYELFTRNIGALNLGQEFMRKFGGSTVLTQKLYAYPDLVNSGEYRAVFNLGTLTKLNKWLGWHTQLSDTYVTNPPAGTRQNDVIVTTGLNVGFGKP